MKPEDAARPRPAAGARLLRRPPAAAAATPARKNPTEFIRENVRKLGLWNSRTYRPIITHDDLSIVMLTLGFVGLGPCSGPGGEWKEYAHSRAGPDLLRPRLPFPRLDGLHMVTYASFLDSVNFYLRMDNIADVFHVRAMPLHRIFDRNDRWRRMEDDDYSVFLYRFGTLEQPLKSFSMRDYQNEILGSDSEHFKSMLIHKNGTSSMACRVAPLEDIIVKPSSISSIKSEKDDVNVDTKASFVSV